MMKKQMERYCMRTTTIKLGFSSRLDVHHILDIRHPALEEVFEEKVRAACEAVDNLRKEKKSSWSREKSHRNRNSLVSYGTIYRPTSATSTV